MSLSQKQVHSLIEVSPQKENWNVFVRVVWLWFVADLTKHKSPFSMELVLEDKKVV